VNLLFAVRYLSRLEMNTPLLVAVYLVAFTGALAAVKRVRASALQGRYTYFLLLALISVAWIVVFQLIDYRSVRVDRWYMIDTFWSNAIAGRYPYTPRPNSNIPGPLPFYYVLAAPFHLAGDIGYFALAGFLGYGWLAWRVLGGGRGAYLALTALLLSISFLWEMTTRSTIVVNMVVALAYLHWLDARPHSVAGEIGRGLVGGLVLSTRTVVALPLLVYAIHAYVRPRRFRAATLLCAGIVVGFVLTMMPLYFWDPAAFQRYNPLLVQSEFSTGPAVLLVLLLAAVLGWSSRSFRDVVASAGIVLFAAVLWPFAMAIARLGLDRVVYGDYFDPSYFNLSVPFLTFALGYYAERPANHRRPAGV